MDDRLLVEAIRAGDPMAPRELIARFQGIVFGLCLRMLGHRHDAEDAMQETFIRALRGMVGFDASRPLRPWILEIAANRCRTALALRTRRPPAADPSLAADRADDRAGPRDPDDLAGELELALARLRPEYRAVFALFHEQGLSYEEVAGALDRPVGTIKTWLHRARGEMAAFLVARGVRCQATPSRPEPMP